MISVAFLTLGCPKNEVDTDKMRARVASSSYVVTDDIEAADIVVINTCSFIVSATEESIETILDVVDTWVPNRAGRHVLVAGCLVSRYGDELVDEFPEISAFVPIGNERDICARIEELTGVKANANTDGVLRTVTAPFAYLMIADGCHRACAYCTIPSIRGPYTSKPLPELLKEAADLAAGGIKELVLIGQDITAYGRDFSDDVSLIDVIRGVCDISAIERVRLMYLQPDGVTDELLGEMAAQPKMCHYVEMPLQHCDETLLRSMRRSGDKQSFINLVTRIRSFMPDASLRTTLIAGYPGETDEQFEELLDFVRLVEFDYVGVFPYSPEDGTPAALLPNQLDESIRLERAQEVRDCADAIGWSKASSFIGSQVSVLVEGLDTEEGAPYGRTCGQAPDIDGIVKIDTDGLDSITMGSIVSVNITDSVLYDLEGVVVQ